MEAVEASVSGTVRIILVLLIIWWALRLVQRWWAMREAAPRERPGRAKGEVRIESAPRGGHRSGPSGKTGGTSIADADYEEIEQP